MGEGCPAAMVFVLFDWLRPQKHFGIFRAEERYLMTTIWLLLVSLIRFRCCMWRAPGAPAPTSESAYGTEVDVRT